MSKAVPDPLDGLGYVTFFEMSLDHLCVAGFDGYWKRLNPSWSRTLGWTHQEMMAVPLVEFVHPDDRTGVLTARGNLTHGQPLLGLTNRYRCKDGSYRWFEWRSVADVRRELVYAIARDVTAEREAAAELDRLRRQLMLADRLASVGTLAAGVAHEINNPLAYVCANLDMLIEELAGEHGERLEMAREAREGADRIRTIVRGLKTFSRSEAERRQVIDVIPVIELSINMANNEIRHRARLVRDYGPIPHVEADDSRLGQVFINLLVNAAQAMSEHDAERNEIRIATSTDAAGNAVIDVFDTGRGIPPDALEHIFEPFFTTKPAGVGTGLGLSICHNIVSAMGGQLVASNRPGGGASFRLTLPRATSTPVIVPPRPQPAPTTRRASVLVVDDDVSVAASLGRQLRQHDVTSVTTARAALDLVLAGKPFDVILSDLMMPGMSGMELHAELVRTTPDLASRMVFITGGAFTTAANEFLDRIDNDRLDKPFTGAEVRAAIERVLDRGHSTR
jgi:PAS domain S-box-containing protein